MLTHAQQLMSSRRGFLIAGAAGGLGLGLGDFLSLRSAQASSGSTPPPSKAKSVIHVFLQGGMAAQESWDPKPLAPIEYRGELKSIATNLPGVRFSELLGRTAKLADKLTVIRSLTHGEAAHERGVHNMLTGYRPSPALTYPSFGSVVSHELGSRKNLPPYICVPNETTDYDGPGYLSTSHAPFSVGSDPARRDFKVRDLSPPSGVDAERFARRKAALAAVNKQFTQTTPSDAVTSMSSFYERAFDLINSKEARGAFDLSKEENKTKDRYGRSQAGQRMLLARRLVEAGARFVTVGVNGWDHHQDVTRNMRRQLPPVDQALSALLTELDERGLLDETLVMVSSEFGRTPKLNGEGGRDHWSKVFSVALAGGGIKRGAVVGSSGPTASEPEETPITPEDLATTLYHLLGISITKELIAPGARPIEIVKGGQIRKELLA